MRDKLPAITHVDGSARLQTVSKDINPMYHDLIRKFGEKTDVPVLLNTSFNIMVHRIDILVHRLQAGGPVHMRNSR